jgi:ATPase subunit of ABC transporter with duplicated ATPase domains
VFLLRIGVIGLNGSGKSSLMKIIGGKDAEFDGEVVSRPGLKIGYLAQVR